VIATIAGIGGGASAQRSVTVDTAGPAQPFVAPVAGNDSISPFEALFAVSGTAEANASVAVSLGSGSRTVVADANGAWQTSPFTTLDLPVLASAVTLTAVATDQAGNQGAVLSRSIAIEQSPFSISPQSLAVSDTGSSAGMPGHAAVTGGTGVDALASLEDPIRYLA
jgi:hypothetical protein